MKRLDIYWKCSPQKIAILNKNANINSFTNRSNMRPEKYVEVSWEKVLLLYAVYD